MFAMTARRLLSLFPLLLLCCGGCIKVGPRSDEDIYKDLIRQFDDLSGSMTRVMDERSAQEAKPRIQKTGERILSLVEAKSENARRSYQSPNAAEIKAKYEPILSATIARSMNQFQRIRQQVQAPAAKELAGEVAKIYQQCGVQIK